MDSAKIFIDTDNEITFILEKILASKSDRVCLVIPDRASLFTSISGLKLIKRVIDKSSKLLVLVTLDENGRSLAEKAGLHVVSRVGEVTESLWDTIQKSKFDVIKNESKKIYYIPQVDKQPKKLQKQVSATQLVNDMVHEAEVAEPAEQIESVSEKLPEEIPQVRIKVDDFEIKKEKVDSWKREQESMDPESVDLDKTLPKNAVSLVEEPKPVKPQTKEAPAATIEGNASALKKEEKYERTEEEKLPKPTRMRKNPLKTGEISNLSFTVGKDLSEQKKK